MQHALQAKFRRTATSATTAVKEQFHLLFFPILQALCYPSLGHIASGLEHHPSTLSPLEVYTGREKTGYNRLLETLIGVNR